MRLNIIANWMQGSGLSGGDRIFIELSRRWVSGLNIKLFISSDGWKICQRERLDNIEHEIWAQDIFNKFGYPINYLYRTFASVIKSFRSKIDNDDIVYSSSDFWPDSIPAFITKLKNRNIKWIAGFYMFAPRPWRRDFPYKEKKFLTGFLYYLTQLPIYWIVTRFADMVFVTSEPDVEKFITKKRARDKVVVVCGGVNIGPSTEYLRSAEIIPKDERKYDACFVGRFHPQKGVLELVDIWRLVCKMKPEAKLAMIGIGPLEEELRKKIKELNLESNIDLLGFKDGKEKYEIFKQSKIIVHPATYDSGGMAAAEAMAWELPGVSFDLEALKTYYPCGMVKVPPGDHKTFAKEIIELLDNKDHYLKISKDARDLVAKEWDWERRTEFVFNSVFNNS